jgi:uncharacterized glyoxalase superfamily protein PhnB
MSQALPHQGISGCRPILYADSVSASLRYYSEVLGFKVGFRWSDRRQAFLESGMEAGADEVGFALVFRDSAQLMLCQKGQGQPGMWLHLDVETPEEVDALHRQWSQNGARIIEPPEIRPWKNYEMRVADLDGHVLRVASPGKPSAVTSHDSIR